MAVRLDEPGETNWGVSLLLIRLVFRGALDRGGVAGKGAGVQISKLAITISDS